MLKAYIDDSGSHAQSKYYALGGLLAPSYTWGYIEHEWDLLLDRWKLDYFKTSEAESCRGQFDGWDKTERDKCLHEFLALLVDGAGPTRGKTLALSVSISRHAYRSAAQRNGVLVGRESTGIHLLLLMEMVRHMRIGSEALRRVVGCKGRLACVLDNQHVEGANWDRILSALARDDMIAIAQVSSKAFVGLQAADLFAWAVRRTHEDGKEHDIASKLLRSHLKEADGFGAHVLNDNELDRYFQSMRSSAQPKRSSSTGSDEK